MKAGEFHLFFILTVNQQRFGAVMLTNKARCSKNKKSVLVFPALTVFILSVLVADCLGAEKMSFENGLLTFRAVQQPLEQVLEQISNTLGMDVYLAEECRKEMVTISLEAAPVEQALRRILRSVGYAVLYGEGESGSHISELKVYPRGKAGVAAGSTKLIAAPPKPFLPEPSLKESSVEKIQESPQSQKVDRSKRANLRRLELFQAQKAGNSVQ
ncbi:MAG TPA: hypothetical protein ENN79_09955 [Desulfobacteraceae bacterium]|nr:hypothetical protein [Desulfobacteraceae bacterium]